MATPIPQVQDRISAVERDAANATTVVQLRAQVVKLAKGVKRLKRIVRKLGRRRE